MMFLFPYISISLLISLSPYYISASLHLYLLVTFLFPYISIFPYISVSLLYFYLLTPLSPYYIPAEEPDPALMPSPASLHPRPFSWLLLPARSLTRHYFFLSEPLFIHVCRIIHICHVPHSILSHGNARRRAVTSPPCRRPGR